MSGSVGKKKRKRLRGELPPRDFLAVEHLREIGLKDEEGFGASICVLICVSIEGVGWVLEDRSIGGVGRWSSICVPICVSICASARALVRVPICVLWRVSTETLHLDVETGLQRIRSMRVSQSIARITRRRIDDEFGERVKQRRHDEDLRRNIERTGLV